MSDSLKPKYTVLSQGPISDDTVLQLDPIVFMYARLMGHGVLGEVIVLNNLTNVLGKVVCCANCGLMFATAHMTLEEIDELVEQETGKVIDITRVKE